MFENKTFGQRKILLQTQSPLLNSFLFELEYGKAINAHKAFWEGGRKSGFAIFFRPSLDAPRTHQIQSTNHTPDKRRTGYESDTGPA